VIVLEPSNAGLALARRLVGAGARVTVVEGKPIAARSRGVESVLEHHKAEGGRWLEVLHELSRGCEEGVLLTATDRGSAWLVRESERLPPNLRHFEAGDSAHMALMDKQSADGIARRAGVRVPWTAEASSVEELEPLLDQAPWPCVVKPVLSHEWRERFGAKRSFLASDPDEARRLLAEPLADGFRMLLSQYIPGGDEDVEEGIVVRLADGSYPVQFGVRKLRQYPRGFGETAVGESAPLPETMELAKRVLDEAGFVGVAGVETKRHADTDERWFLEVNVRLPGQWGLGDACGVRASTRVVRALAGRPLDQAPPLRSGVRFVQPDLDWRNVSPTLAPLPLHRRPAAAWRLARPYFGAGELGLFDLRDPGPLLAVLRQFAGRRVARVLKRPVD
jgi:predicted ATP-grasp superfamily ATP-dependent carboligase